MPVFHISEIYGDGEDSPVPGPILMSVKAPNAIAALNAYSDREGFAPYSLLNSDDPDAIIPHVWDEGMTIASAPFCNSEIMAYTDEVLEIAATQEP